MRKWLATRLRWLAFRLDPTTHTWNLAQSMCAWAKPERRKMEDTIRNNPDIGQQLSSRLDNWDAELQSRAASHVASMERNNDDIRRIYHLPN